MAAPGAGAGGRRASAAAAESNENDDLAAAPSYSASSSAFAHGPAPHFSLPPRSPLAAIADPGRNPRSAPATPKSLAGTPRACAAGSGARDRTSSIGAARRVFDLRDLAAAEVPHFELDDDSAFWKDRNVQVLIRIRPISDTENAAHGQKRCLMQDSAKTLSWTGHPETMFSFDHVACETISQEKLFRVVGLPMVENCMSGYNGCLFAYGQTGSGKTYTMMGELTKLGNELSKDSGLTPRIFEYLFARINEEEERGREDNLKYICKCSFLEIYNEQITDLLEPSSTNLQIREDIKKGVYVENLMECYVSSVKDVMLLLLQGVANRKMVATNMNSESSRSHCVFTCVIESHWESDSMTHLRFGRLNLVDLAGSERQKSSGAEGERLKEATNINRSLSTLGLVIMTLVEVANGKSRHVPYRDSRLTFLLQDSLGGNSKTTIVASIIPSICSSNETLSTLKFAQRAKLIQNNAKVNEDASGDLMALQRQIEELKDQLTCLKKQQNCHGSPSFQLINSGFANEFKTLCGIDDQPDCDLYILKQKVSHLEDVLVGSLRREKSADTKIGKLEAEIKHLNRLVDLMESDTQRLRRRLELRDEEQRRQHLMDENTALSQEIQLLQDQINENPQLTHFALENKRLIEELRTLQNFHKQGEREMLLTEISLLRNHFLHILGQKYATTPKNIEAQGDEIIKDLDNCRKELDACLENNVLLSREVNKLRCELIQYQKSSINQVGPEAKENVLVTSINPMQHDQAGQTFSYLSSDDVDKQFMQAGTTTSITESFQLDLPYEIDSEYMESPYHLHDPETHDFKDPTTVSDDELDRCTILNGLNFLEKDGISHVHEKAPMMDIHLHGEILSCHQEIEIMNSSKHLSQDALEQVKIINQELRQKLVIMAEEGNKLSEIIVAKDVEIASLSQEWEAAMFDLTSFLTDGCRSLDDAYQNVDNMISSFPHSNSSVNEHVEKAMKISIEKEKVIFKLQIELQDAQKIGKEAKEKLHILRGAALAITEAQQLDNEESFQEALQLVGLLHQKDCIIQELENNLKEEKSLYAETEGHPCDDLLPDSQLTIAEQRHDENGPTVSQANPYYQSKLDSVLQLVEDKSNKVLTLFSNFEEAQETMEEAELMLSALLKANEELILERDNGRQAVELLLSEKTSLINELKELEASNSCTSRRYDKLHQQINDCVVEMAKLAGLIRGLFQQIQSVTTVELFALCSEIINFVQDLKRCISESRSYLVSMVSLVEEKGRYSAEQFHHLNANDPGFACQQVESHSCQWGSREADISDSTQAIQETSSNHMIDMAEKGTEMPSVGVLSIGRGANLEDSNKISMHDMTVVNNIVSSIAQQWDIFVNKVSCVNNAVTYPSAACAERNTNIFAALEKLESRQICSAAPLQCEGSMEGYQRDQNSTEHLLNDVESLKHHLAQLIVPLLTFINNIVAMGNGQEKMLHNCQATVNVNQLFAVLNKMSTNLNFVIDLFGSLVMSGHEGFQNIPLLSNIAHDISNIEKKALMLLHIQLCKDNSPADYSADYALLRREFDRKNNIAEGLSFDLKLLQESTSNAKDMKDKADEIYIALSNVKRELDMKTSAMENMLKKQKALEEELAENGAGLIILRSELKQSQSLSSELLKENKDLRVMLEEETVRNSETKVLLEDKVRVIEGLERQILFLNCSEAGQLMSDIEELNNSLKIMSSDRENLQAEIPQLRDKLEIATSLAEEHEAAAIEGRQTAEISRIYAEEKEEEVKILERSVEELEATITVLEEEVCNLKEEVRSYQLLKQSEAEFQAVGDMLAVENASKCDAPEELCQGKCHLEKRMQAEIIAHQNAKKKIEGLRLEAKRKDEEIRQYKEHIAELVLHSEAQSLLFQEKYQEMEHMVSKQNFGPHESSSETVRAKIEKPSGRARGSGSPFRCISSIIEQMNSEKDQEISVARQRIEELEGMVSSKQKEICLLTSRLASVDSMTHDIIRELLGVKLDMANYANLLDKEELHKLLIASQQQIEQSKSKDTELEVLKEQLGHLILERDSLLDDMDQRKTDLLESQLLVEQLEQREQMLEAQIKMFQVEKDNLQQKIMEMDETIELLVGSNKPNTTLRMGDNHHHPGSSEFSRKLAQSDMLLFHARHEHSRSHATRSSRTHRGRHQ
ncbi:LOW QUALITY PROTEIN: kinesin-like protein KIN-12E [Phragmites australis]|uniref:LOW QUALITY PROTEIN: kinesin-like protein KIN-12E n=1 Tax=Phragmites australis TaxID=29695 RepID=UPI002D797329|nr:LOW QUALITY PROTEIN: kinesin-like protein KIN-12E [Phragmites australis]